MARVKGRAATDQDTHFRWQCDTLSLRYPTHAESVARLKGQKLTKDKWHSFVNMIVFTCTKYGTYGRDIFPALRTVASQVGHSRDTVAKWLDLAEDLGLIVKVAEAASRQPAVYVIGAYAEEVTRVTEASEATTELGRLSELADARASLDDPWAAVAAPLVPASVPVGSVSGSNFDDEPPF